MKPGALWAICAAGLALLFSVGTGWYDLWPADEPRYGEVAREMMSTGDYLAPHVNGEPYTEKPPLLFWAIALCSRPFGDVNSVSARLPSNLAALIVCWVTFLLARDLYDRKTALLAVVVLATCGRFWWQARTAQIDMLLTANLATALYCFWLWHTTRAARYLVLFYGLIALAVYAKGPPGVVFPLLLIFTFYWKQRDQRRATHWVLGIGAVAASIAAWLIPARASIRQPAEVAVESAIGSNLFRQTLGRFVLGVSHAEAPWYYLENLPVDLLPWTLLLPYTLFYVWRNRKEGEPMRFLLAWTVPALIFFSISVGKRALYLLPLYPVFAILVSRSILDLYETDRATWLRRTRYVWFGFVALTAVAPFAIFFTEYRDTFSPSFLFVTAAALAGFGSWFVATRRGYAMPLILGIAVHAYCLEVAAATTILPAVNAHKSAAGFCAPMRMLNESDHEYDLYSLGFSREEYIFYSKRFHEPVVYGLLEIDLPEAAKDIDPIEIQVRLRKALSRAMEDVHVESYSPLSDQDRSRLKDHIDAVLDDGDLPPGVAPAFRKALNAEAETLRADAGRPAVVMVQEEDYRWLFPLLNVLDEYSVMIRTPVGSRDMLLLANASAAALLKAKE